MSHKFQLYFFTASTINLSTPFFSEIKEFSRIVLGVKGLGLGRGAGGGVGGPTVHL